eukprot:jgi/Hompol1/2465/HPOL_000084-RA
MIYKLIPVSLEWFYCSWDEVYALEVDNFVDHGDKGEVWFGEDSVEKMIDWVNENWDSKHDAVIDLGCGNGHLLFELETLGFTDLVGVDYSERAIDLAIHIARDQETPSQIAFERLDILDMSDIQGTNLSFAEDVSRRKRKSHVGVYPLALDKGTLDAISLSAAADPDGMQPADVYVQTVARMLAPGGVLLLTSCNWTEPEILKRFEPLFEFYDRVKYRVFEFGGHVGQTITTVALKKK